MTVMTNPTLTTEATAGETRVHLAGQLLTQFLDGVERAFSEVRSGGDDVVLDLSSLEALDTGGAWLVTNLRKRLEAEGVTVTITGAAAEQAALLEAVAHHLPKEAAPEPPARGFIPWLHRYGLRIVNGLHDSVSIISFFGLTIHRLTRSILRPGRLRWASVVTQLEDAGYKAVPIIALMGFLIGVVLAFQGAAQLRQFGAEVFVVELISISILRELGILLTAIIVAGRSGSAFTASIGSMKVQEEIDAMRTLGLDPVEVLVVPRTIALLIALPILGLVANIAGLFGGALMAWLELGVSPGMFLSRLHENTEVRHLAVGIIKAPFFAVVIGVVSCWQAMQVTGSAESVGHRTTTSVVQSIFTVIALDALFSIFFAEIGY